MKEFYVGDYPKHIPMMPDKVFMEDIRKHMIWKKSFMKNTNYH